MFETTFKALLLNIPELDLVALNLGSTIGARSVPHEGGVVCVPVHNLGLTRGIGNSEWEPEGIEEKENEDNEQQKSCSLN